MCRMARLSPADVDRIASLPYTGELGAHGVARGDRAFGYPAQAMAGKHRLDIGLAVAGQDGLAHA